MPIIYAYCDARGVIEFGPEVAEGCLPIVKGEEKDVRDLIGTVARHARPRDPDPLKQVYLVPGIPEAPNQKAGMDALLAFKKWLKEKPDPRFDFSNK